jgi:outer membrane immunogenic protein
MKPVPRLLGLAAAILLCVGHAYAADLGRDVDIVLPETVAGDSTETGSVGLDWSGAYFGVEAGYGWNRWDGPSFIDNVDGALLGLYGGYNFQAGSFVYGIDGSVDFSFADFEYDFDSTEKMGWSGNLRARFGVAFDSLLLYAAAGAAGAEATVDDQTSGHASDWQFGWTAAGGAEFAFSPHLTGRLDLSFTDYGTFGFFGTPVDITTTAVKAGIGYRF